jgi:hypothetical protein
MYMYILVKIDFAKKVVFEPASNTLSHPMTEISQLMRCSCDVLYTGWSRISPPPNGGRVQVQCCH